PSGWSPWVQPLARAVASSTRPAPAREARAGCNADRRYKRRPAQALPARPKVRLASRSAAFLPVFCLCRQRGLSWLLRTRRGLCDVHRLAVLKRVRGIDDDPVRLGDAPENFQSSSVVASNVDGA